VNFYHTTRRHIPQSGFPISRPNFEHDITQTRSTCVSHKIQIFKNRTKPWRLFLNCTFIEVKYNKVRVKLSLKSLDDSRGRINWKFGFHPYFGNRYEGGTVLSSTRRSRLNPEEIPWYAFLLEAAWTPRHWMRTEGMDPDRKSNPETPILWCSASTSCAATRNIRSAHWKPCGMN